MSADNDTRNCGNCERGTTELAGLHAMDGYIYCKVTGYDHPAEDCCPLNWKRKPTGSEVKP